MLPDGRLGDADSIHGEIEAAAYSGRRQSFGEQEAMKPRPSEFPGRFGN